MLDKTKYFDEVKSYKFIANKSLGQNFLVDSLIAEKIVEKLEVKSSDNVLEIGAGLGSLSYFLSQKEGQKTLIDVDEKMLGFLQEKYKNLPDLLVKRQNILKADLSEYTKIIGNLPYYITSGIVEHILLNATNAKKVVLMCQKEVYPKLTENNISPLSILLNYVSKISSPMNVSRNAFAPVPHVDSVVFELEPNGNIKNPTNKDVYKLMCKLFLHRRKNILNCLSTVCKTREESKIVLSKCELNENLRPEQLKISDFQKIFEVLQSQR